MSVPTHVETFPLFFEVDQAHKLNYFRNIRNREWDLSKEKEPLYLWQPNVEPGPKGGRILDEFSLKKKQKTDFKVVNKKTQLTPNQQNWKLATGDGTTYTLQCDEGDKRNYYLFTPRAGKFVIQKIDDDFSATKDTEEQDYEQCEKMMEYNKEQRYQDRKAINKKYAKFLEDQENNRKKTLRDQLDNGQLDEDFVDVDDVDRIDDKDVKDLVKQRIQSLKEDADVDAPLDRSDDETFAQDVDESKDDLIDMEELNALFEDGFLDEEDEYEEDGEKKDKKEKKKEEQKPEPLPSDQVAKNIDQIVEEVNGPRIIREEEFVRYFLDNGQSTGRDLMRRFKDYMKTPKQRDALVKLIKNKCKKIDKNGVSYFQLRSGK